MSHACHIPAERVGKTKDLALLFTDLLESTSAQLLLDGLQYPAHRASRPFAASAARLAFGFRVLRLGNTFVLALNTSHSVQEPLKICREEHLANSFDPLGYFQTSLSEELRFCSFAHF